MSEVARHVALAELADSAARALAWCADDGGDDDEQLEGAFEERARYETALAAARWQAVDDVCDDELGVEARVVVAATHSPAFSGQECDRLDSLDDVPIQVVNG